MCKNSLKSLETVKSLPANLTIRFLPLLIYYLAITGIKIASILSSIFSIITEYPFSIAYSKSLLICLDPNLKAFKLFSFSFSFIQEIP